MTELRGLVLAMLVGTSTWATAQNVGTAPAPQSMPSARTAQSANGFTIDEKGVKRTGDPLPDVDVSLGRPGSKLAPTAATIRGKPTKEQREADLKATSQADSGGSRSAAVPDAKSTAATKELPKAQ